MADENRRYLKNGDVCEIRNTEIRVTLVFFGDNLFRFVFPREIKTAIDFQIFNENSPEFNSDPSDGWRLVRWDEEGQPFVHIEPEMPTDEPKEFVYFEDYLKEKLEENPEFREAWENQALNREVSLALLKIRTDFNISQQEMAEKTGLTLETFARLEAEGNVREIE